jgi:hypothetical protein
MDMDEKLAACTASHKLHTKDSRVARTTAVIESISCPK